MSSSLKLHHYFATVFLFALNIQGLIRYGEAGILNERVRPLTSVVRAEHKFAYCLCCMDSTWLILPRKLCLWVWAVDRTVEAETQELLLPVT